MKSTRTFLTISLLCLGLLGCSLPVRDQNLVTASYRAADALIDGAKELHLLDENPRKNGIFTEQPILTTSFVNIDDLQQSSTFGRVIGEQIGSRIAQHGYKVIEMKMRTGSIFVQEHTGELVLSRELREISYQHDAYAIVVGTYADSKDSAYVTAKLVRTKDSVVLSSYDYKVAVGPDTRQMLRKNR
jgi:TolB-like protein